MKSIIKNNTNDMLSFIQLTELQSAMMIECLKSGLNLSSTIAKDPSGVWTFNYGVGFVNDHRIVFNGSARKPNEPHYCHIMALIRGTMVSELFPPADPLKMVAYWKRHLITDIDVTDTAYEGPTSKAAVKSMWVGFTDRGLEIARVADGTNNPYYDTVARIEYTVIPTRGACVFVVRKDYIEPAKSDPKQSTAQSTTGTAYTAETLLLSGDTGEVKN